MDEASATVLVTIQKIYYLLLCIMGIARWCVDLPYSQILCLVHYLLQLSLGMTKAVHSLHLLFVKHFFKD